MRWAAVAPFFNTPEGRWLIPFVPPSRHQIEIVRKPGQAGRDWHASGRNTTSVGSWRGHWEHVRQAWETRPEGLITVFPHLAAAAGMRKLLSRSGLPIVAWTLNIGRLYTGPRRILARQALRQVDCYVVHARRECEHYSSWFDLPRDRFVFVPLQRGRMEPAREEDEERIEPFVLAMGSAHRDYRTLFEAVAPLGLRTVVVTGRGRLNGLRVPGCVEVRHGLTLPECRDLSRKARVCVVPVSNDDTASGQVTVIESMWLGRPVIATRCLGTEDYIDSGTDGLLVNRGDPAQLREAILQLFDDDELRRRLGRAAHERAEAQYSDEAAGAALGRILDRFAPEPVPAPS